MKYKHAFQIALVLSSLLIAAVAVTPAHAAVPGYVYSTDEQTPVRDTDGHCVRTVNGKEYAIMECATGTQTAPKAAEAKSAMASAPAALADSDKDGVPDSADKCPNTPPGVKVDANGCPQDSDNDGVADYLDKCPGTPPNAKVDASGCVVSITLKINFDSGQAVVDKQYLAEIEHFSQYLKQYPDEKAEIQGHTDNLGGAAENQALSEARAKAVREVLVAEYGISAGRLTAKGYGEDKPIADNNTKEGREKNRRVEAVISK